MWCHHAVREKVIELLGLNSPRHTTHQFLDVVGAVKVGVAWVCPPLFNLRQERHCGNSVENVALVCTFLCAQLALNKLLVYFSLFWGFAHAFKCLFDSCFVFDDFDVFSFSQCSISFRNFPDLT